MTTFTNTVKTAIFSSLVISLVSGCQVEITTAEGQLTASGEAEVNHNQNDNTGSDTVSSNDYDNDGVLNSVDAFPNDPSEYVDTDNDGLGNNADADDDGDGFSDSDEAYAGTDPLDNTDYPVMNTARTVEVSWDTPTAREDGSSLYAYEIQGYEVKYRHTDETEYNSVLLTLDPSELITSTTLDLDGAGVYEFTVAVYDVNGLYSDFSQPVQVSIQ